uniref:Uncharacterized protein n=1 Tax=Tetradesmus obliquus TaxID=3088 RepID=A0A383VST2_TETOB|eukprot:jgi/Sobl393_1/17100/SZX68241.1
MRSSPHADPAGDAAIKLGSLQQPQQLAAAVRSAQGGEMQPGTMEGVWHACMKLVAELLAVWVSCKALSRSRAVTVHLAVSMTQQLLQSGVLASWIELMQVVLQHWQRKLSYGRVGCDLAMMGTLGILNLLLKVLDEVLPYAPAELAQLAPAALPLLQQLQCYSSFFAPGSAAAAVAAPGHRCHQVWWVYIEAHQAGGEFVQQLSHLAVEQMQSQPGAAAAAAAAQGINLLRQPAAAQLLL